MVAKNRIRDVEDIKNDNFLNDMYKKERPFWIIKIFNILYVKIKFYGEKKQEYFPSECWKDILKNKNNLLLDLPTASSYYRTFLICSILMLMEFLILIMIYF